MGLAMSLGNYFPTLFFFFFFLAGGRGREILSRKEVFFISFFLNQTRNADHKNGIVF